MLVELHQELAQNFCWRFRAFSESGGVYLLKFLAIDSDQQDDRAHDVGQTNMVLGLGGFELPACIQYSSYLLLLWSEL